MGIERILVGHTFADVFVHLVWSTKNRQLFIDESVQKRLYDYIGGIVRSDRATMIASGGTIDHIHLLVKIGTDVSLGDLVRKIKSNSSKFINSIDTTKKFSWQAGYGVFSVSHSNVSVVKTYISQQDAHHRKMSFGDEFVALLKKHEIIYDERFIFD